MLSLYKHTHTHTHTLIPTYLRITECNAPWKFINGITEQEDTACAVSQDLHVHAGSQHKGSLGAVLAGHPRLR
jgi:hypothetical protein